jgi:hypothetical protein
VAEKPSSAGGLGGRGFVTVEVAVDVGAAGAVAAFSSGLPAGVARAPATAVEVTPSVASAGVRAVFGAGSPDGATAGGDPKAKFASDSGAACAEAAVGAGRAGAALCTTPVAGGLSVGAVDDHVRSRAFAGAR